MQNNANPSVKIMPPDFSLRNKIGGSLDQVFTAQVVNAAEKVIEASTESLLREGMAQTDALERANNALQKDRSAKNTYLPVIIDASFSIKTKVASAGYDLASALAKSLHILCEYMKPRPLTARDLEIIQWHVTSLRLLLRGGLKGNGGPTGSLILEQLQMLAPPGVVIAAAA